MQKYSSATHFHWEKFTPNVNSLLRCSWGGPSTRVHILEFSAVAQRDRRHFNNGRWREGDCQHSLVPSLVPRLVPVQKEEWAWVRGWPMHAVVEFCSHKQTWIGSSIREFRVRCISTWDKRMGYWLQHRFKMTPTLHASLLSILEHAKLNMPAEKATGWVTERNVDRRQFPYVWNMPN